MTSTPASEPATGEEGPEVMAAVVRARMASRVADVMAARTRLVAHEGAAADEEAVHDYRVALRRLRSALRALRIAWGKAALVPLEDELKALADATGDVRDEEVLAETLARVETAPAAQEALARWSEGRARRLHGARAAAARKLGGDDLGRRLSTVLHAIEVALAEPPVKPMGLQKLRARSIGRLLDEVVHLAKNTEPQDVEGMHRLRIRVKRVRYAIELLFDAEAPTAPALKKATRLQRRLGELHDVDEALARMARAWGLTAEVRSAVGAALRELRDDVARKAKREVASCVPELQRELDVLLATSR